LSPLSFVVKDPFVARSFKFALEYDAVVVMDAELAM
jgi:hypothetical protein